MACPICGKKSVEAWSMMEHNGQPHRCSKTALKKIDAAHRQEQEPKEIRGLEDRLKEGFEALES
jgi:hypothetical protein